MATNLEDSARAGKTETLNEVLIRLGYLKPEQEAMQDKVLVAILTRIQRMQVPDRYILMCEHWDWLVVLQCLQDNGLFKTNPQRMPLTEFERWLRANNVPQMLAICTKRTMSYANDAIHGARYPWANVDWNSHVLERWQFLYRTLDTMLQNVTNVPK